MENLSSDEEVPGRPHVHVYFEFCSRKSGYQVKSLVVPVVPALEVVPVEVVVPDFLSQVKDLFGTYNPRCDRVGNVDPRTGRQRPMLHARQDAAPYCKKGSGTPKDPDVLEWGVSRGDASAKDAKLLEERQLMRQHRAQDIEVGVAVKHFRWLEWDMECHMESRYLAPLMQ
jgi:hypothetical protein